MNLPFFMNVKRPEGMAAQTKSNIIYLLNNNIELFNEVTYFLLDQANKQTLTLVKDYLKSKGIININLYGYITKNKTITFRSLRLT